MLDFLYGVLPELVFGLLFVFPFLLVEPREVIFGGSNWLFEYLVRIDLGSFDG